MMDYREWKAGMRRLQTGMGQHFEDVLEKHLRQFKGEVIRNPELPDRKTPDFRVTDQSNRSCYIEAKVLLSPRTLEHYQEILHGGQAAREGLKPHTRSRLGEKLGYDIDGTYTESNLQGVPLVVAFLDAVTQEMLDLEEEAYGGAVLDIRNGNTTHTGEGVWASKSHEFEDRKHIHGIWVWPCRPEFSLQEGRIDSPTLATNPWLHTDLPDLFRSFRYWVWEDGPSDGQHTGHLENGGMAYDCNDIYTRCKVGEYIQRSRELAASVRNTGRQ